MNRQLESHQYLYLAVGTLALLCLGLIYAWSIFKAPIQGLVINVNDTELSMTFTISMISFCLGGFFSGMISKHMNLRFRLLLAGVLVFAGLILMSTLSNISTVFSMYVYYGILCGLGVGVGYNSVISGVLPWFTERVGVASGVLLMGFGFGGLVLGSFALFLEQRVGINQTFIILGVILASIMVLSAFVLQSPRIKSNSIRDSDTLLKRSEEFTPIEMLRTSYFWWFVLWSVLISSSGLMIIGNAAQMAQVMGATALVGLIVSVANGIGRIFFGQMYDTKGRGFALKLNAMMLLTGGVLLVTSSLMNNALVGTVGLILCGMCYGGAPSLSSTIVKEVYGSQNYPSNFSVINFQLILAAILGPTLADLLKAKAEGSFIATYIAIIAISMLTIIIASKLEPKGEHNEERHA